MRKRPDRRAQPWWRAYSKCKLRPLSFWQSGIEVLRGPDLGPIRMARLLNGAQLRNLDKDGVEHQRVGADGPDEGYYFCEHAGCHPDVKEVH